MSSSLLDDISAELLVCRICLGSLCRPKTLSCRHTFCQECLQKLRDAEFTTPADDDVGRTAVAIRRVSGSRRAATSHTGRLVCPVCHQSCSLPAGGVSRLPGDPVVSQLCSVIERHPQTTNTVITTTTSSAASWARTCEICAAGDADSHTSPRRHRSAQSKCIECNKFMCSACLRIHRRTNVTRHHSLLDIESLQSSSVECQHHSGEPVRFYCDTCDVCVCVLCTYTDQPHSDSLHNVLSFTDAVAVHQLPLATLYERCKQQLHDARIRHHSLAEFHQHMRKVEDTIHEVATETVSHVRRQERQLVAALHQLCGIDIDDDSDRLAASKRMLEEQLGQLESVCGAAERLLNAASEGSGAALFLLQRRRTLDAMTSSMTSSPADVGDWPNCQRQVRFQVYGLDSALALNVGQLIVSSDYASSNTGQKTGASCGVTVAHSESASDCNEVISRELGAQAPVTGETLAVCQASGSSSAPNTRLSVEQNPQLMSGTTDMSPRSRRSGRLAAGPATAASWSEHVRLVCDAWTATAVSRVDASTETERLQTTDQSTSTHLAAHQLSLSSRLASHDRSTETDLVETICRGVTARPLTADMSTLTDESNIEDVHYQTDKKAQIAADASLSSELMNIGLHEDSTSTAGVAVYPGETVNNGLSWQNESASNSVIWFQQASADSQLHCGDSADADTLVPVTTTSCWNMADSTVETPLPLLAPQTSASTRLVALLPEIARTADILRALYFSSGVTARLLQDIVDVGVQLTAAPHRRNVASGTEDHFPPSCDVKWTQTASEEGDKVDQGVGESLVTVSDVMTATIPTPTTFDKETSTTRAYHLNKNVATDSLSTADKQTWMPVDISTAYLSSAAATAATSRRVVTVSRGTGTYTPPPVFARPSALIDRATSPVRVVLVDKSVTASKAEALQPLDTFQAAGHSPSGPLSPRSRRPLSLSPRSKLACISESAERNADDDETGDCCAELASTTSSPELLGVAQKRLICRRPMSAQLSTKTAGLLRSSSLQQPLTPKRTVFNFDHVITSHFNAADELATTQPKRSVSLTDLPTLSVANDANCSSVADTSLITTQTEATLYSADDDTLATSQLAAQWF